MRRSPSGQDGRWRSRRRAHRACRAGPANAFGDAAAGRSPAQPSDARGGHPARPLDRRDGRAGRRAGADHYRRPSRLPAGRDLAPHLLRPLRGPRCAASSRRSRRPTASCWRTSRGGGGRWCRVGGPDGRRDPSVVGGLGGRPRVSPTSAWCRRPAATARRRAAPRGDRPGRRAAGRRGAPAPALPSEPVLAGALGGVWELALRKPGRRARELDRAPGGAGDLPDAGAVRRPPAGGVAGGRARERGRLRDALAPDGRGDRRPRLLVTELTGQTLRYLNGHPGAANIEISRALDVRHESQMSRHLGRLERAGMVTRRKEGRTNAWPLTDAGREAAASVCAAASRADRAP